MIAPRPPVIVFPHHCIVNTLTSGYFLFPLLNKNLRAMMGIVEEFEKTISQLISEKERESVCNVIARER